MCPPTRIGSLNQVSRIFFHGILCPSQAAGSSFLKIASNLTFGFNIHFLRNKVTNLSSYQHHSLSPEHKEKLCFLHPLYLQLQGLHPQLPLQAQQLMRSLPAYSLPLSKNEFPFLCLPSLGWQPYCAPLASCCSVTHGPNLVSNWLHFHPFSKPAFALKAWRFCFPFNCVFSSFYFPNPILIIPKP